MSLAGSRASNSEDGTEISIEIDKDDNDKNEVFIKKNSIIELVKDEVSSERARYVAQEFSKYLSEDEMVVFIGELARYSFYHRKGISQAFRNSTMLITQLMLYIFEQKNFPCAPNELKSFFESCHDIRALEAIKEKFSNVNDAVIKVLLPIYHAHVTQEDADKDIKKATLQHSFLSHVSFAFVETLVMHISSAAGNIDLAKEFRFIRENLGVMDSLITQLDKQLNSYKPGTFGEKVDEVKILQLYHGAITQFELNLQILITNTQEEFLLIKKQAVVLQQYFHHDSPEFKKLNLIIINCDKLKDCKDSHEITEYRKVFAEKFKSVIRKIENSEDDVLKKETREVVKTIKDNLFPEEKKKERKHSPRFHLFHKDKPSESDSEISGNPPPALTTNFHRHLEVPFSGTQSLKDSALRKRSKSQDYTYRREPSKDKKPT